MEEATDAPVPPQVNLGTGVIGLTAIATVVFGLYWGPLIDLAERASILYSG